MLGRFKIFLISGLIVLALLGASCAPAQRPLEPSPTRNEAPQAPDMRQVPPATPQPPTQPGQPTPSTPGAPATVADTIADEVARINGVESANVLVVGRTAFIGCNLDKEMDDGQVERLKDDIADRARNFNQVTDCLVSADPDVAEQIRDISEGRSTPDSIGDLYNRLKPQR
ncbi:MAG: YhcN/YlaJ family sporulation lipoprotein [Desulfitobacteriaceae bacterium]|nr:YhcN/YlaJ family sporulation lipoprotein [Desulfitobacteriaceae bacterium]MDD4753369.1 YhcN/YlaJ family sporulation lipoprotein [Desulfitobacteriaceae bacterium]